MLYDIFQLTHKSKMVGGSEYEHQQQCSGNIIHLMHR